MYSFNKFFRVAALIAVILVSSCGERPQPQMATEMDPPKHLAKHPSKRLAKKPPMNQAIVIQVYSPGTGGFGYALYENGRKIIDQPNIPAVQHQVPFRSKEDAENTARLVSRKLETHQFPPAVTIHELDSLRIRY